MAMYKGLAIALMGVLLFSNCSQNKTEVKVEAAIDTQTVLRIGSVSISAYELKKNNKDKMQPGVQYAVSAQNNSVGNWKNDFVDKTYFLADAYDKGYNTNKHIDSIVDNAARFMVAQKDGLLEQAVNAEYKLTDDEFKKAVERRAKEISIEYLKFKDKDSALKSLQGITFTAAGFKKLYDKVNLLDVTYKKDILTWPFKGYWGKEEEIYALKNGEVLPLLALHDGYYLIHAEKISELSNPVINEDHIKAKLEQTYKQKTTELFNSKVHNNAKAVVDDEILEVFSDKLNNYKYGPAHTFLKKDFSDILSKPMLTYISPLGQTKTVTVNDFIENYNTSFLKANLKNGNDVYATLNNVYFSDYAYNESVKKGITVQPKFILDRNNYKNNVIYAIYAEQELADKGAITENEIIQMYNIMKPHLTQPEKVIASIYYFNNQSEAIQKKVNLNVDTLMFKSLTKAYKHLAVDHKTKVLADTIKKTLFDLSIKNNPARIIESNGKYVLVVKENETGIRTKGLKEARELVIAEIKNQRLFSNRKTKLAELKNKYKPKIDLVSITSNNIASK